MKNLESIFQEMLDVKSRAKLAGARTSNRLSFQACESLVQILEKFDSCDEFFAVFDYHEDFILYLKEKDTFKGTYYQMKTASSQWSIDSLIAGDKKSGSIISKMFEIGDKFKAAKLEFISNKKVKARKVSDGKAVSNELLNFPELHEVEVDKISSHLNSIRIVNLSSITLARISSLPLKVVDRDNYLKGLMVTFVDGKFPQSKYSPYALFLSLTNEVERRLRYEDEPKDIEELLDVKCITKKAFEDVIKSNLNYETLEKTISRIESQLQSEKIEFASIKLMKNGVRRLNTLRIAKPHYFGLLLKEIKLIIEESESDKVSLYELSKDLRDIVQEKESINEKINVIGMNKNELLAMVIYEVFEN